MKTVDKLIDDFEYAVLGAATCGIYPDDRSIKRVADTKEALRTAIEELAADAARMDALDTLAGSNLKTDIHTGLSITTSIYHRTGTGSNVKKQAHGRTFREAVDVFMKEST